MDFYLNDPKVRGFFFLYSFISLSDRWFDTEHEPRPVKVCPLFLMLGVIKLNEHERRSAIILTAATIITIGGSGPRNINAHAKRSVIELTFVSVLVDSLYDK